MGDLGKRIRDLRLAKGLTQPQLAAKAGISQSHLSNIEQGGKKGAEVQPSGAILKRIAQALEVLVGHLLGEAEGIPAPAFLHIPRMKSASPPALSSTLADYVALCKTKGAPLDEEEVWMLEGIRYKGRAPETVEDWDYLMESIKRTIR